MKAIWLPLGETSVSIDADGVAVSDEFVMQPRPLGRPDMGFVSPPAPLGGKKGGKGGRKGC